MSKNNVVLGIGFAFVNAFMLAGMSLFTKLLLPYFGAVEVVFWRNIFSLAAMVVWLVYAGKFMSLKTSRPIAHLVRGAIGTTGIVIGTWALSLMPLAETTILLFTAPLFVVLLSYPVLREPVGLLRISAVIVGFMGVVVMVNPFADGGLTLPILGVVVGLGWGFLAGCVDVCLRWMGKTESSTTTVFYFVLFGTLATALHWPWAEIHETSFSMPAFWIMLGLGATGLLALLAKTQSFRLAEAALITPVMYSMIIWTILFDYLFWSKMPSVNVLLGAAVIIASNLFILYREMTVKSKDVSPQINST